MNKISFFLFISQFMIVFEGTAIEKNYMFCDELTNSADTLKQIFLFETHVDSYIEGKDAVLKDGGFIKYDSCKVGETYDHGYFTVNLSRFRSDFLLDSVSVMDLYERLIEINWTMDGVDNDLNPFCGTFYRKFYLEIIVNRIGVEDEIVPLPLSCSDLDLYHKENKRRIQCLKITVFL